MYASQAVFVSSEKVAAEFFRAALSPSATEQAPDPKAASSFLMSLTASLAQQGVQVRACGCLEARGELYTHTKAKRLFNTTTHRAPAAV